MYCMRGQGDIFLRRHGIKHLGLKARLTGYSFNWEHQHGMFSIQIIAIYLITLWKWHNFRTTSNLCGTSPVTSLFPAHKGQVQQSLNGFFVVTVSASSIWRDYPMNVSTLTTGRDDIYSLTLPASCSSCMHIFLVVGLTLTMAPWPCVTPCSSKSAPTSSSSRDSRKPQITSIAWNNGVDQISPTYICGITTYLPSHARHHPTPTLIGLNLITILHYSPKVLDVYSTFENFLIGRMFSIFETI